MKQDADVIIIGGGLAGLSLAGLLGRHGVDVICIDRDDPVTQMQARYDGRTTAISYGSRLVLEQAGVWDGIEATSAGACPIRTIQILDGDSPVLLEFKAEEVGGRSFGWIVDNRDLRIALYNHVRSLKNVRHIAPAQISAFRLNDNSITALTKNGDAYTGALVIGADGRTSFTREYMGIGTREWMYGQQAIVCIATHENPHNNIAVEHFRSQGPFATLPMLDDEQGRHRSSVVWTEHTTGRDSAMHWPQDVFDAALTARFPDWYGEVKQAGGRFAYPLGLVHAHSYTAPRTALVADAAHAIHPIAGQGLNLGFRDIGALAELIIPAHVKGEDIGSTALLDAYQKMRRFDNMAMAGATDGLTRLFSNNLPPLSGLRKIGLRAVSRIPVAKQFFMNQAMGAAGLLPDMIKQARDAA